MAEVFILQKAQDWEAPVTVGVFFDPLVALEWMENENWSSVLFNRIDRKNVVGWDVQRGLDVDHPLFSFNDVFLIRKPVIESVDNGKDAEEKGA